MGFLCGRTFSQNKSKSPWDLWPLHKDGKGFHYSFSLYTGGGKKGDAEDRYSFFGDFHCPRCGQKSEFMVLEFQEPSSELMAAWGEIKVEELDEDILRCPTCSSLSSESA